MQEYDQHAYENAEHHKIAQYTDAFYGRDLAWQIAASTNVVLTYDCRVFK